jgi:amidase
VKAKLEAAGHKVIDWVPLKHDVAYDVIGRIYSADGGEDIRRSCQESGEPVMYSLMDEGQEEGAEKKGSSVYESWQVGKERDIYRKQHLDHWQATVSQTGTGRPVDAVLAPVSNLASCPHNRNDYVGYTTQWNLLDQPVVVMPITHVDPAKDKAHKLSNAFPGEDQHYWDYYDENKWTGLPVNLGLVGKRLQDEELLGLAKVVVDAGATL